MKWYSVHKYRPPSSGYCLIRTENGHFYAAEWRDNTEDIKGDTSGHTCGWMIDTLCEEHTDAPAHVSVGGVTHFCVPEPVPVETER